MSYCVNCGVELGDSEKKCILCGCSVVNPMKKKSKNAVPPYPKKPDEKIKTENRHFYAIFLTALFALPSLTSFFLNILYFKEIMWSIYVIGAFSVLWVCIILPIIIKKINAVVFVFFDYFALLLYILTLEIIFFSYGWFFPLALPVIVILFLLTEILVILIQKSKIFGFQIPGVILFFTGLLCMAIDMLINIHFNEALSISWSVFVLIPTLIVSLIFFIIEKNENIREELIKRFHF